jgi:hypothetical protein
MAPSAEDSPRAGMLLKTRPSTFGMGKSLNDGVAAVRLAPAGGEKVFYENSKENVSAAIEERINKKQKAPTMTAEDKKRIGAMVEGMKKRIFTKEAIKTAMFKMGTLEGGKSKKWTDERFQQAIADLMAEVTPQYEFKASVKNEPMSSKKAPRMLIADGDRGQIMAVGALKVLEIVLFKKLTNHCIKERSKEDAMENISRHLNVVPPGSFQTIIEGDGSAWDTTCSHEIRELTENPLVEHIVRTMRELGWPYPESWDEAHKKANSKKQLRMKHSGKTGNVKFVIDAIRRSGHRGTSSLNYIINFVLTHVAILDVPHLGRGGELGGFLDDTTRRGKDRWGEWRQFFAAFEGDDSIIAMSGAVTDEQAAEIMAFWDRCGFNMKLYRRTTLAEFTGWKLPLDDHGRVRCDCVVPDIIRTVTNAAWTTSNAALQEARLLGQGGPVAAAVAAASMFCYKISMHRVPTVYRLFERWEEDYKKLANIDKVDESVMSVDQRMKAFGEKDRSMVQIPQVSTDTDHEYTILEALGLVQNKEHWQLLAHCLDQLSIRDPDEMAVAIPWGAYKE